MSAATIEATKHIRARTGAVGAGSMRSGGGAADGRPRQLRKPRRQRPGRGSGRRGGPIGRSTAGVAAPSLGRGGVDAYSVAACHSEPAARVAMTRPVAERSSWRLTERGIAVVLITGAVLLAAAVTVITATAITVTSADYVQPGQSAIVGR